MSIKPGKKSNKKLSQKKTKDLERKILDDDEERTIVISDDEDDEEFINSSQHSQYSQSSQSSNSLEESTPIELKSDKPNGTSKKNSRSFTSAEDELIPYRSPQKRVDNIMKQILKTPSPLQFSKPPDIRRHRSNDSNMSDLSLHSYHFLNPQEMEEERRLFFGGDEVGQSGDSRDNRSSKSSPSKEDSQFQAESSTDTIRYYSRIAIYSALTIGLIYFVLLFVYSFHMDYTWRLKEAIESNTIKTNKCRLDYIANRCSPKSPRALQEVCKEYELCSNRQPTDIKRTQLMAEIFGDIAGGFINTLTYKAMLFYFLFSILLLILIKWILITGERSNNLRTKEKPN